MRMTFKGKKISSILSVLPQDEILFEDEAENYDFPVKQTMRLKRIMGFKMHRVSKDTSTVSDFAVHGMKYMLDNQWIRKEEIGAIVVVTLCPDYFVPHIGNIVQAELALGKEILCLDIAQGCCGFLVGLSQSFMLLEHMNEKKVVLINGDVLSHKVSKKDRNEYPLIGDGVAITVVENNEDAGDIVYEMNMDGKRGDSIIIPAGGFRKPSDDQTAKLYMDESGNRRALDHILMDGSAVFNFVQTEIPPMITTLLDEYQIAIDDIDYFFFHQPNKFMLQKLSEKLNIPPEKMPMNLVENVGNTSGASIPMVMTLNNRQSLKSRNYKCLLSAFGSGLAWGAMLIEIGELANCDTITSQL